MKKGLVMEGGSMRGLFTAGVIDVFMEKGITFDGAIGVSAGATFGCNIKSGQIGRALRYNCKYCKDDRYGTFKSLLKTGDFFDKEFCYYELPLRLDPWDSESFQKNPMEFWVVATDVANGKALYHPCKDGGINDLEWIRASASIPMLSKIVEIDGQKLLDGGIADSIPLKAFQKLGYDKNVVICTRPADYVKKKNKATPLCRLLYAKYPKFIHIFANRHTRYNQTLDYIRQEEAAGTTFVIRPPYPIPVKSAEKDPENLKKAYQLGREAALDALENRHLEAFLGAGAGVWGRGSRPVPGQVSGAGACVQCRGLRQ